MNEILTLSDEEVDYWGDQYLKWQQSMPEDLLSRLSEFERQQYFWAHNFTFSEFINLCLKHVNNSTPAISRFK
jgi:predicted transcriptional regulator